MLKTTPIFLFFLFLAVFYNNITAGGTNKAKTEKKEADNTGTEKTEADTETEKIGNFSLPESQQPFPLTFFSGNIIAKGKIQFFLFADAITGRKYYKSDIVPGFLYGITNSFSVFLNVPIAPKNKDHFHKSSGLEDIFIQLEYAFYSKAKKDSSTQATIVGNIAFPTGSFTKNPRTGFGSINFLTGLSLTHTTFYWIYAADLGLVLTTKHKNFKVGNQLIYQAAIGRNLYTPPGWIIATFAEFAGVYSWKDIVNNRKDPNSGGNIFSILPSFWISSEHLVLQFGIGLPITQHLFGKQPKPRISYNVKFGWTFE